MKNCLKFFFLALCTFGCDDEPLPPCQLSQTGWVCQDQGSDTTNEVDLGRDMKKEDVPPVEDVVTSTDVVEDQVSADVEPDVIVVIPPKTCAEVKDQNLPTGNYTIEIDGQMTEVHCNSDIADGGWMLIGRSVAGGLGVFGWNQKAGSAADDNAPYSLGSTSIAFTQALATNYANGKTPGDRQYVVTLPNNFLTGCVGMSCQTTVTSPTNSCANNVNGNDIFMFDYAGWVGSNDNLFWFRERIEDATTGFRRDGWNLFFDDCRAGELHTQQGLLFVR